VNESVREVAVKENHYSKKMLITIIVVAKNNISELRSTVKSVSEHIDSLSLIELIVIDASETNNDLKEELSPFGNWVYLNEADNGIFHGMNKGLKLANSEYVWFLNSGDRIPAKVEIKYLVANLKGCDWAVGKAIKINTIRKTVEEWKIPKTLNMKFYLALNSFPHQSTIYNLKKIRQLNGFQEKSCVADWELSLQLLKFGAPIFMDVTLSECKSGGYSEKLSIGIKAFHQTKSRQRVYGFGTIRLCIEVIAQFLVLLLAGIKKGLDDLFKFA
jgi:hypothetical protein